MKKIVKLTENDITRIVKRTLNEDHATSDSDKIGYIITALDDLSSDDLNKIYNLVEDLETKYDGPPPPPPNTEKSDYKGGWPYFQFELD
jgi:hypothetical protein